MPRGFTPEQRRTRFGGDGGPRILPTQVFYERLREEDAQEREKRTPFLEWALRIPEPKTGTLDFRRWKFQRDMYRDEVVNAKEVVVQKSTQVGISVWLIRSALYWPDMKGLTAVYIFPKKVQLGEFVQQRIRPLVRQGEYLPTRVPRDHIDNTFQKQIGLGYVNFRGSDVIDDLDSIDADWIGFDEYDRLNQKNIEHAEHRVDASPLGLIRRIGNPTIDEYGVSASYEDSDKRQWHVRCERCGSRQLLDFDANVDQDALRIVCADPDCRDPLDVREGEWVAEQPDRDVIGFHVSRLMDPTANLRKIVANSKKRDPDAIQVHKNKDLGLPFTGGEDRLTIAHLKAAQSIRGEYEMPFSIDTANPVTMGVDMASKRALNAVVSEWFDFANRRKKVLWVGAVTRVYAHDPGEGPSLQELMERYGVNMAHFDHEPEYLTAMGFCNAFPGRGFVVRYAGTQKAIYMLDPDMLDVAVRRTEVIDRSFARIRAQHVALPINVPDDSGANTRDGFFSQMRAAVRMIEENDKGQRVARYEKIGPYDDYAHANVYDDVAADTFAVMSGVEKLVDGDEFSTLDEHMQFDRSDVDDPDAMDYRSGPDENLEGSWGYR